MIEEEYKKVEVTYKFYLPDNRSDLWLVQNAEKMWQLLSEIDDKCRSASKYGEIEVVSTFADEVREMIYNNVDLDEYN